MAKGNLTLRMDSELKAQAMESAKNNEDLYGPFDSVKDLMSDLF